MNPYGIALVAGGFTIIGALLGAWLMYRFAIKLANRNARHIVGLRLREAFAPELAKLQHPEGRGIAEIPHILKTAFEKHQMAVNEFRFFLAGDKLDRFNKAWKEYDDYPDFNKYIVLPATSKEDIQKVIDRINAILDFTKDK